MEIILTSIIAFATTNIDDIFILTLFYGNRKFKHGEIVAGQALGIGALVAISLVGSLIGLLIDPAYIGLLGLIPVYLGLKSFRQLVRNKKEADQPEQIKPTSNRGNVLSVAGVTIANGGDNIGIYIPLFATMSWMNKSIMVGIFFAMVVVWCWIARFLAKRPVIERAVDRYGHWVTPFVLILLGIFILYESGSFGLLSH